MERQELTDNFIARIEEERCKHNLKQNELAKVLGMSVSGYRKMISGNTDSVSLFAAYKAAELFDIPIEALCSYDEKIQLASRVQSVPDSVFHRIKYYLDMEKDILKASERLPCNSKYVDVLTPIGFLCDGMQVDSYTVQKLLIKDIYGQEISKGVRVTENSYIPVYAKGDILLINEEMARNGDIVLLIYAPTRKFYIRKLLIRDNYYECRTICGRGENIIIKEKDRKQWIDLGHVVATIH